MRKTINFNNSWLFSPGEDIPVEAATFGNMLIINDETKIWQKAGNHGLSKADNPFHEKLRKIDLPHDFVIEGEFAPGENWKTGSLKKDKAWYIKKFHLPEEDRDKRIVIEFDGIYRNSQVFANGHFVGRRLSGYSSLSYDITEICEFGKENCIAVFVDATENEQWSYEGGGIYRSVRLLKLFPLHVAYNGIHILTGKNKINIGHVESEITVSNNSLENKSFEIQCSISDSRGRIVSESKASGRADDFSQSKTRIKMSVDSPGLWSPENPVLYKLTVKIFLDGQLVDEASRNFGFRYFRFDPQKGFFLNGKNIKMKGVCIHQDHAGVGIAVPHGLQEWRIRRLQSMGCNAIRVSHHMPDPALLDICDKLGMMVMNEIRLPGCAEELQRDLCDFIVRDRNHPSVIIWCLGNEEMAIQYTVTGVNIFRRMQHIVHKLDPSRPTTYAMNGQWVNRIDIHLENNFQFDIFGANYRSGQKSENYDIIHEKYPEWPLIGTETWGGAATRGLYSPDKTDIPLSFPANWLKSDDQWRDKEHKFYASAYGGTFTPWGYSIEETWQDCAKRPFMAGTFIWTGFDYRGETFPYGWPAVTSRFGILDYCGYYKEVAHYLRSWWRPHDPYIFIMPHWNWHGREGEKIRVWCYGNSREVELFINNRSVGRQVMPENFRIEWQVPFEAGELKAVGYDEDGKEIISIVRRTAHDTAAVRLFMDEIDDIFIVNAAITDSDGEVCPEADNQVEFDVNGPAKILGVGNGNPVSHEPDKFTNKRHAFHGLCQMILMRTGPGKICIRGLSEHLTEAKLHI